MIYVGFMEKKILNGARKIVYLASIYEYFEYNENYVFHEFSFELHSPVLSG